MRSGSEGGQVPLRRAGFALAMLAFTALGAASAVLVVVVARRLGIGWRAATAGGLFYAMWFLSVRNEYLSRLEPLGNLLVLCGIVGYAGTGGRHSKRSAVLCGAGLGAATSVKIWYAVPLAVVLCFLIAHRRPGDAGRAVLGAGAAVVLFGLNALHRNLANGCQNWIDVTGRTYASDMKVRGQDGSRVPRIANPRWQQVLRDYLLAGDAVIIMRAQDVGVSPTTWDAIRAGGILATDGEHVVYRVDRGRN